jgi:hypothetical protein
MARLGSTDPPLRGPVIEAQQTSTLAILKLETEPEFKIDRAAVARGLRMNPQRPATR